MTIASICRIAVPYLALVAACSAAAVFGITHVRREPPPETSAAAAVPKVSTPASAARDEGSAALAAAAAEANAVGAELAVSPRSPVGDELVPVFDIARIERTGDAVIAGRAAPGAIVELLRNDEQLDRVVADPSGQFVMVPPRLPPGDYELTLRARLPNGTLATSKQGVAVALAKEESNPGAFQSRAEIAFNGRETAVANRLVQDDAVSRLHATAAAPPPNRSLSRVLEPRTATTVATTIVSRGDSLWRISHLAYGVGTQYAVVYKANRDRIRDPNRIYPGQIFVLPMKPR